MYYNDQIYISKNDEFQCLSLKRVNRHGLIAGATGTGKTTTLRVLAESFSQAGVPVFCADIKGDLSGLANPGELNDSIKERIKRFNLEDTSYKMQGFPTCFWDVFGEKGHPVRATISEMGPVLLANILSCTEAQEGILQIAFDVADDNNLMLLDMKDLRSMLQFLAEHNNEFTLSYGHISKQSISALLRKLLQLENDGGDYFFGEPALEFEDWLRLDSDGRGYINILECEKLFQRPKLYATFMLWMLSELYEYLPEVGDLDKPKLVFFFDEAHLLFDDAPSALLQKIEQVVRLIRSKGVGVFFITQSPNDIPDSVLAQLSNRIQHALRAYTPAELKKVKTVAETFRENPEFDTSEAITNLGIGEALLSFIDEDGVPSIVERTFILPPESSFNNLSEEEIQQHKSSDSLSGKYDVIVDRESAYELLAKRVEEEQARIHAQLQAEMQAKEDEKEAIALAKEKEKKEKEEEKERQRKERQRQNNINSFKRTVVNTIGREVSRSFTRTLLGIFKR